MPSEISYISAFIVGLLGGVHCVGMCGGVVSALTLGVNPQQKTPFNFLVAYNSGRIISYTLAGAIVGAIGWFGGQLTTLHEIQVVLKAFAGLFMVAMGLYLAGWWFGLRKLEQAGGHVWKRIEPLGRKFIPVQSTSQAFVLGGIWGWLPCGLVYSVLIWALTQQNPVNGALLMLSFGLGTLPNLLAMGLFATAIRSLIQKPAVKIIAGLVIILFGLYQLYQVSLLV